MLLVSRGLRRSKGCKHPSSLLRSLMEFVRSNLASGDKPELTPISLDPAQKQSDRTPQLAGNKWRITVDVRLPTLVCRPEIDALTLSPPTPMDLPGSAAAVGLVRSSRRRACLH